MKQKKTTGRSMWYPRVPLKDPFAGVVVDETRLLNGVAVFLDGKRPPKIVEGVQAIPYANKQEQS